MTADRWRSRSARLAGVAAVFIVLAIVAVIAVVRALDRRSDASTPAPSAAIAATAQTVERGAYLARAGNCAGCHTARGGAPYAGGTGIATPFGTVYASNLTPDARHGLGAWTSDDFWHALHDGRSRDGRLLYPAFPYPNYTRVDRADADALYAFLRSQPPVDRANTPHALRFPFDRQAALAVWRAIWFRPGDSHDDDPTKSADWRRGRYLVAGLGHCSACHAARNRFGASSGDVEALDGGMIPVQNWYAPSLRSGDEAGVADWSVAEIVQLLRSGRTERASVSGPMADVVFRSTQHLVDADLRAVAVYLKALPRRVTAGASDGAALGTNEPAPTRRGAEIYRQRCASCHGEQGQGARGAYPALAGNRAVTMTSPANLVQMVVHGGYLPATLDNPRPYGMPPFGPVLDDAEIAAVVSYIRGAWGNAARPVSTLEVLQLR